MSKLKFSLLFLSVSLISCSKNDGTFKREKEKKIGDYTVYTLFQDGSYDVKYVKGMWISPCVYVIPHKEDEE